MRMAKQTQGARGKRGIVGPLLFGGGLAYLGWRLFRMMRTDDLAGKVVLITGGSRGLGLALARQFAREGCKLVLCAREEADLATARAELEAAGSEVLTYRCDVGDRDRVEEMVQAAVDRFGQLDVIVNNAGIVQVGPIDAMTLGDFERAMQVNFWGPLHVVWAALPHLKAQGHGRIVNITSIGGKVAIPHLLPYDCAKAAFVSLSEGLYAELARHGVKVTTIVPGLMRTGSPLNASFKGAAEEEFKWFSAGDSFALTSMSADRAAKRIVTGARRGEGQVVLSWQAKLLRTAHALFPNVVMRGLALVNRLLPGEQGLRFESRRGADLAGATSGRLVDRMDAAARRFNQYGNGRSGRTPS